MTTNLNAVAGPSRIDLGDDLDEVEAKPVVPKENEGAGVSLGGLKVDENGDVVKVPAFLNKLYSMVCDPDTSELIYWSDSGDSFFVPNHERFGKELLPRYFKHSNFSSFVRQLNMYGFHKVPHLQSGVLKNDAPSELWEFVSPLFKRGQPELLARVTRKNNRPNAPEGATAQPATSRPGGPHTVHLLTDGTIEGEASSSLVGPQGQLIDLVAIQSGINAIRQTQAAIGADLKALQSSNEHLWREALESRERQQKHEETIDLIVSFLERLFGTEGEGLKGLKEAMRRGGLASARSREDSGSEDSVNKKRRRMGLDRMISDGRPEPQGQKWDNGRLVEINSGPSSARIEPYNPSMSRSSSATVDPASSTSARFTTLPTEIEEEISPATSKVPNYTPGQEQTLHHGGLSPLSDIEPLRANDTNALAPYGYTGPLNGNAPADNVPNYDNAPAVSTDMMGQSGQNYDPSLLQTTIGSLLQSPTTAQMFLNTLNSSSQGQALQTPTKANNAPNDGMLGANNPAAAPPAQFQFNNTDFANDPTLALFSPLPNYNALQNNTNDLIGAYQKAQSVNNDMDSIQQSIDQLVQSMGLQLPKKDAGPMFNVPGVDGVGNGFNPNAYPPGTSAPNTASGLATGVPSTATTESMGHDGTFDDSEFDVNEFLDSLAKNDDEGGHAV